MQQNNNGTKGGNSGSNSQGGLSWSQPAPTSAPKEESKPLASTADKKPATLAMTPGTSNMATYVGLLVAGAIIGILIVWGWNAARQPGGVTTTATSTPNTPSKSTTGTTTDTQSPAIGSDPSLVVLTPQSAGTQVTISKAIVSSPTWVVVYDNRDNKPGNVLGAALFFPERQSGTVNLLRATQSGKTYFVGKRVDDGDRKFSLAKDNLLKEGDEETIIVQFQTN